MRKRTGIVGRIAAKNGIDLSKIGGMVSTAGNTLSLFQTIAQTVLEVFEEFDKQGYAEVSVLLGEVELKVRIHLPEVDNDKPDRGKEPSQE